MGKQNRSRITLLKNGRRFHTYAKAKKKRTAWRVISVRSPHLNRFSKTVYETACMQFYVNSLRPLLYGGGVSIYIHLIRLFRFVCMHMLHWYTHVDHMVLHRYMHTHMDSQALAHYAGLFCLLHRPISRRVYGLEVLSHTHVMVVMAEMSMFCWLLFSERR